jgi:diguanylate cyclase (GGDEF)-like protein/PAS domain S-box-containing protein
VPDNLTTPSETAAYVQAVVGAAPRALLAITPDGTIQWVNDASIALVGQNPDQVIGRNIIDYVIPDDVDLMLESMAYAAEQSGQYMAMEFRYRRPNGTIGVLEAVSANTLEQPAVDGIVAQVHDITDRRMLDEVLEAIATDAALTSIMRLIAGLVEEQIGHGRVVIGVDPLDGFFALAASSVDVIDVEPGQPTPAPDDDGVPENEPSGPEADDGEAPWALAIRTRSTVIDPDLTSLPGWLLDEATAQEFAACWVFPIAATPGDCIEACLIVWRDQAGAPSPGARVAVERSARLLALALERRRSRSLLLHAARHDNLTGLPNRSQFFHRLARELQRDQHLLAVLYLDLDGFKTVNDRYGHKAGDQVLVTVGARIEEAVRPDDMTGRIGGDEFGVICSRLHEPAEAIAIAERLIEIIAEPIHLEAGTVRTPEMAIRAGVPVIEADAAGQAIEVTVGASIGIVFSSEAASDHERLVELADAAMYQAKRAGRGSWRLSTTVPESTAAPD